MNKYDYYSLHLESIVYQAYAILKLLVYPRFATLYHYFDGIRWVVSKIFEKFLAVSNVILGVFYGKTMRD